MYYKTKNNIDYNYTFLLANPSQKDRPLCFVIINDFTFNKNYKDTVNYDTLTFSLERYCENYFNGKKQKIEQPAWRQLKEGMIIDFRIYGIKTIEDTQSSLVFQEYFYVNQPSVDMNGHKDVSCIPYHQHLFETTKVRGYSDVRKLLQYEGDDTPLYENNPKNNKKKIKMPIYTLKDGTKSTYNFDNYLEGGILNYILEYRLNDWTVEYYDPIINHY